MDEHTIFPTRCHLQIIKLPQQTSRFKGLTPDSGPAGGLEGGGRGKGKQVRASVGVVRAGGADAVVAGGVWVGVAVVVVVVVVVLIVVVVRVVLVVLLAVVDQSPRATQKPQPAHAENTLALECSTGLETEPCHCLTLPSEHHSGGDAQRPKFEPRRATTPPPGVSTTSGLYGCLQSPWATRTSVPPHRNTLALEVSTGLEAEPCHCQRCLLRPAVTGMGPAQLPTTSRLFCATQYLGPATPKHPGPRGFNGSFDRCLLSIIVTVV